MNIKNRKFQIIRMNISWQINNKFDHVLNKFTAKINKCIITVIISKLNFIYYIC